MVCLIVFFIFVDRLWIESYFSETKIDEGQLYHCDAHVYFILTFFFLASESWEFWVRYTL